MINKGFKNLYPCTFKNAWPAFGNEFSKVYKVFDDYFSESNFRYSVPNVDIIEQDRKHIICYDLPGMSKETIHISLKGNMLIISGERLKEFDEKSSNLITNEIIYGTFLRSVKIGEGTDKKDIKATYQNGVLKVEIEKKEEKKEESTNEIEIV